MTDTDTIGIAKSTSLFSTEFARNFIPYKMIDWEEWWSAVGDVYDNPYPAPYAYPYPFITGIRPPENFPVAN